MVLIVDTILLKKFIQVTSHMPVTLYNLITTLFNLIICQSGAFYLINLIIWQLVFMCG